MGHDFNDWAKGRSDEELRAAYEAEWQQQRPKGNGDGELEVVRVADVQAEPIRWLWENRFALGKVNLVCGDPGLGKSILVLTIAAHVSRGRPWPVDHTPCPLGDVLLVSGEDDLADTVRPRLEAAGADLDRIHMIGLVRSKSGRRGFCLEKDVARLATLIEAMDGRCRLVEIDPVSAFLGQVDCHNNADVRALLVGLTEMATRLRIAVVLVGQALPTASAPA
jgi:RecA-family ATPase